MNKLIQKYIDAVKEHDKARLREREAEDRADMAMLPKNLRPAKAKDIVEGAVIWYPEWKTDDPEDDSRAWNIVNEVLRPSDPFKAYVAHEGCRYGLDGAFVEL